MSEMSPAQDAQPPMKNPLSSSANFGDSDEGMVFGFNAAAHEGEEGSMSGQELNPAAQNHEDFTHVYQSPEDHRGGDDKSSDPRLQNEQFGDATVAEAADGTADPNQEEEAQEEKKKWNWRQCECSMM
eukprot:Filipodium_phascolosomae@DN879_c0_g1_i1.p1